MKKNNVESKPKKSIQQNYLYNVIYQVVSLITVFLTTPYITRVLGANKIGIYSYTYSIVTYFILFGTMGITLYGQREIAYCQDNKKERSKIFTELVYLKLILLVISIVFFYVFFCINNEYSTFYKLLIFELVGNGIDIMWLYQGLEDFKKVVIKNITIRLSCTALIFIFVKQQQHLWIYFLVTSLSVLLGNLSLWIGLKNYVYFENIKNINIKKHIKPILILFLPQVAVQIYTVLDKTMIGIITDNMTEVGLYQKTQEIVKMGMTIVTAFGTVIFPRIAYNYKKKYKNKIKECIKDGFTFVWLIGLPLAVGLASASSRFIPWYLGNEFVSCINCLQMFSIILIVIGLNNVVGMQYLIATKNQSKFTIAVTIGAISNIIGNIFLIKVCGVYGAIISSIIAEIVITIIEFAMMKEVIKNSVNIKQLIKSCIGCLLMSTTIILLGNTLSSSVFTTIIQMTVGLFVYFITLIILRSEIVIDELNKILTRK